MSMSPDWSCDIKLVVIVHALLKVVLDSYCVTNFINFIDVPLPYFPATCQGVCSQCHCLSSGEMRT